jgi:general secretion pathway protein F
MGILLGSGLNMLTALQIATKSIVSVPIREQVEQAITRVREGSSLSGALSQCSHVPRLLTHLAANGEASGELPRMLETAAQAHEREVALRLSLGLNLLEPLLILLMGLIVGGVVVIMMLSITSVADIGL